MIIGWIGVLTCLLMLAAFSTILNAMGWILISIASMFFLMIAGEFMRLAANTVRFVKLNCVLQMCLRMVTVWRLDKSKCLTFEAKFWPLASESGLPA
jgi:ATP/ADP translocase